MTDSGRSEAPRVKLSLGLGAVQYSTRSGSLTLNPEPEP